jgi:hypothetical protein
MNLFLRAKHWQLFSLTFGIPILLEIIMMSQMFSHMMRHPGAVPDVVDVFSYFKIFPFIMLLFMGVLLGWQWSVAVGMQKMVPAAIKMKVTKFKVFFFIPVVYITLIIIAIFFAFSYYNSSSAVDFGFSIFIPFLVIVPLHLFSMFCLFYCLYFVAKTLKTVELQREVTFNDFVGEFFLSWFFPIGVWILQPRINKLIKQYNDSDHLSNSIHG